MNKVDQIIHRHFVTRRDNRFPRALAPDYFNIDEMTFEDLLSYASEFSRYIKYFDLNLTEKGNWFSLFENNDMVVMAEIMSANTQMLENNISRLNSAQVLDIAGRAYQSAQQINQWMLRLLKGSNETGVKLAERIRNLINEKLVADVHTLGSILQYLDLFYDIPFQPSFEGFSSVWRIESQGGLQQFPLSRITGTIGKQSSVNELKAICYSLTSAIKMLQTAIPPYKSATLNSQTIEPSIGLLISFLQLYKQVQKKINNFTQDHRDFYYFDLLKLRSEEQEKDKAYLLMTPFDEATQIYIKKGDLFSKDKDQKLKDILYQANDECLLSDVRVNNLHTLFLQRDRYISPESLMDYVTRIKASHIPVNNPETSPMGEGEQAFEEWPLFGEEKPYQNSIESKDADIGIAFSSQVLSLREGQRDIEIEFEFLDYKSANMALSDYLKECKDRKEDNAESSWSSINNDCLYIVFEHLLKKYPSGFENTKGTINSLLSCYSEFQINQFFCQPLQAQRVNLLKYFLMAKMAKTTSREHLLDLFGSLYGRHLISGMRWLSQSDREFIVTLLDNNWKISEPEVCKSIKELLSKNSLYSYYKIFKNVFRIEVTGENGWLSFQEYSYEPVISGSQNWGMKIHLSLHPGMEAIIGYQKAIHGEGLSCTKPVVKCCINHQANFFPYSLFSELIISNIAIDVKVKQLRKLNLYNHNGQLDATKPFQPFGPLPSSNSYFAFASYEMAFKKLESVSLNIEWGDLPSIYGGFREYYQQYSEVDNQSFTVSIDLLSEGKWVPIDKKHLFSQQEEGERLASHHQIHFSKNKHFQAINNLISEQMFRLANEARNGHYKMKINEPDMVFGHREYPVLLSDTIAFNAKVKEKLKRNLPNTPYTPIINDFSVNYHARDVIDTFNLKEVEHSGANNVFHIHSFANLDVGKQRSHLSFIPRYAYDGNLFIGFNCHALPKNLSLFFHMAENSRHPVRRNNPNIQWFYLSYDGWKRLPKDNVLSDDTQGLLKSGLISLSLPSNMRRDSSPDIASNYWLRVSTSDDLEHYSSLIRVVANVIEVKKMSTAVERVNKVTAWKKQAEQKNIKSLVSIYQQKKALLSHSKKEQVVRISERLKHKFRAVTPLDYELLIIEHFPELQIVKCFANLCSDTLELKPGHLLILVVPNLPANCQPETRLMANSTLLKRIYEFVGNLSTPFAEIEVRNPSYERVQVRCSVKFENASLGGLYVSQLNRELSEYISPWYSQGTQCHFGWRITEEDVESFIRRREYVQYVTNFSMLHIYEHDKRLYTLVDTVDSDRKSSGVKAKFPWSLPLPDARHSIEVADVTFPVEPDITGINELEIGSNFIIKGVT
ncbi:hypothetical protein [Pleionea sp. CnH1-48]|uniref:hypothetical protein n=1 Tax=Pleionea sp. CnH1-48 TaxID=2954494 RepID=UPI002096B455|nr:hypothetical protein [Pleionea sp. CnH1-48]MCO7226555.1 hypothetical protein [Pleionea sp. CnH1-48]